jgi:hypothetical protein
MPSNYILGKDGKLYVNDPGGGTYIFKSGSPDYSTPALLNTANAFSLMGNCRDVTLTTDTDEVDITTRDSGGFTATIATNKSSTIEFEAIWRPTDAVFGFIQEAWEDNLEIAVMALDGLFATTGSQGLIGNFTVPGFSRSEPVGDVMKVNVTLKGSSFISWYTVPA